MSKVAPARGAPVGAADRVTFHGGPFVHGTPTPPSAGAASDIIHFTGDVLARTTGVAPPKAARAGPRPSEESTPMPENVDLTAPPAGQLVPKSLQISQPGAPIARGGFVGARTKNDSTMIPARVKLDVEPGATGSDDIPEEPVRAPIQPQPVTFMVGGPLTLRYPLAQICEDERPLILLASREQDGLDFRPRPTSHLEIRLRGRRFDVVSGGWVAKVGEWTQLFLPIQRELHGDETLKEAVDD